MITKYTYGRYNQDDLKKRYEETGIKDSSLYVTSISSKVIRSLKVTINTPPNKTSELILNDGRLIELVYLDNGRLFYAIGVVRDIHSPESFCLDCSSAWNSVIKNINVGDIRFLRLITDTESVKGGLHISVEDLIRITTEEKEGEKCGQCGQTLPHKDITDVVHTTPDGKTHIGYIVPPYEDLDEHLSHKDGSMQTDDTKEQGTDTGEDAKEKESGTGTQTDPIEGEEANESHTSEDTKEKPVPEEESNKQPVAPPQPEVTTSETVKPSVEESPKVPEPEVHQPSESVETHREIGVGEDTIEPEDRG